jgi:hypothetical protein
MTPVELVQSDSAPDLTFTLSDAVTGSLLDLTTLSSAALKFRRLNTTTVLATLVPVVLGAPANGQLTMPWGTTLTTLPAGSVPGFFEGQLKLTFAGPKLLSSPVPIQFYVILSF